MNTNVIYKDILHYTIKRRKYNYMNWGKDKEMRSMEFGRLLRSGEFLLIFIYVFSQKLL